MAKNKPLGRPTANEANARGLRAVFRLGRSTTAARPQPGPVIIRNLTAQPLTLKHLERFESSGEGAGQPSGGNVVQSLTKDFGGLLNRTRTPVGNDPRIRDGTQSYEQQDVDVRVEAFTTRPTDINIPGRNQSDVLRLILEEEGGARWQIDLPTPSSASQTLKPISPDPQHEYTAIFDQAASFLAIFETPPLRSWMREFSDDTSLAALSIPGTHNSPTHHKALPSVRCQAVSPFEQLTNGVRFFDIRVQPSNPDDANDDALNLVHGAFPISLTGPKKFRNLVDDIERFLRENPSETLVMSLKREGTGNATDDQLAKIVRQHYARDWYTDPRIPTLGQARGKIVLLRRFTLPDDLRNEYDGRGWALDAESWDYNTPNCTRGAVCVQDFCEVLESVNIEKKITLCCEQFERAAEIVSPVSGNVGAQDQQEQQQQPDHLYLNFLSASNFWAASCWPDKIAAKLNPAVTAFLCQKHEYGDKGVDAPGQQFGGDGGLGVVVCDWVGKDGDWDLIKAIVGMNTKRLVRERGRGWR